MTKASTSKVFNKKTKQTIKVSNNEIKTRVRATMKCPLCTSKKCCPHGQLLKRRIEKPFYGSYNRTIQELFNNTEYKEEFEQLVESTIKKIEKIVDDTHKEFIKTHFYDVIINEWKKLHPNEVPKSTDDEQVENDLHSIQQMTDDEGDESGNNDSKDDDEDSVTFDEEEIPKLTDEMNAANTLIAYEEGKSKQTIKKIKKEYIFDFGKIRITKYF